MNNPDNRSNGVFLENLAETSLATNLLKESIGMVDSVARGETFVAEKIKKKIQEALPLIKGQASLDDSDFQEEQPESDPELIRRIVEQPRIYEIAGGYREFFTDYVNQFYVFVRDELVKARPISSEVLFPTSDKLVRDLLELEMGSVEHYEAIYVFLQMSLWFPTGCVKRLRTIIDVGDFLTPKVILWHILRSSEIALSDEEKLQFNSLFIQLIESEVSILGNEPDDDQTLLESIHNTIGLWKALMPDYYNEATTDQLLSQLAEKYQNPVVLLINKGSIELRQKIYKFDYNFFERNIDLFKEALALKVKGDGCTFIESIPGLPANHHFLKFIDDIIEGLDNDDYRLSSFKAIRRRSTSNPKLENLKWAIDN